MTDKDEIVQFDAKKITSLYNLRKHRGTRRKRLYPANSDRQNAGSFNVNKTSVFSNTLKSRDSTLSTDINTPTHSRKLIKSNTSMARTYINGAQLQKCVGDADEI
jgi:hypothetical protein